VAPVPDVVIAGYGPAGAAAAIAAHDAGRSVLILESAERGGGNARYSGGFLFDVPGDAAVAHLDALCFGRTGRRVLEAYAAGLHELDGWLCSLGGSTVPFEPPPARGFGRIIFVVSDTVWAPPAADLLPYVTSKGALIALARALAMAHGPDEIAVTCVAPGLTDTPAARADLPAAAFDAVRARQALPRALRPEDVAATVAFLASDGAAALTGQVLCTDGGLVMR
jgi:NAD(P)-dependent dehydrogenase (short-subunit alcohol dehydrogenase family)